MKLSEQEISTQTLTPDHHRQAVELIKVDGYVVFESALPQELVSQLRADFLNELEAHVTRTDPNRGRNRYQMHLPFRAPFNDAQVITNTLVLPIIEELLGDDAVCHYFASDTALPGSDFQAVHSDIHLLFPETTLALPAYSLVLNVPLVDFRADNGPVEIWPGGTHLMPGRVDMQTLAPQMHSQPVLMPAGSLLLRDMRMWHRGTPNHSDEARPNLAFIYSRPWLKTNYPPIEIEKSCHESLSPRAQKLFRFEQIV